MRKLLLILPLLPAIALAKPPLFGEPPCGDMPPPKHHKSVDGELSLPGLLEQIDLSEKQKTEIKNLLKAHHAEFEAKLDANRKSMTESHRLSFSNDYSEEKILALFDESYARHKDIALHKAQLDNAIFKRLTEEQQQKLQNKIAQLHD